MSHRYIYIYISRQTFQPLMEKQPFIQKHRKRLCISTGIKREDQLDMIPVISAWSLGKQLSNKGKLLHFHLTKLPVLYSIYFFFLSSLYTFGSIFKINVS